MKIIGITGTLGAGKGTIVDYLITQHHYMHFSVRGYLIKLLTQKGLEINRDTMVETANNLRAIHGPSFIAEELFKEACLSGQNCIIESIRTLGEVNALRLKGNFKLIAVDANRELRYQRITERASETDKVSYQTFVDNEEREMDSTDPNKQNIGACMALADIKFSNDRSLIDLYKDIDLAFEKFDD